MSLSRSNLIILYREGGEGRNTQDTARMSASKIFELIRMYNKDRHATTPSGGWFV